MKVISNFNKETKDIKYILENENVQYDLSKIISVEIPFNNSFLQNIPEKDIINIGKKDLHKKLFPNMIIYEWYYNDPISGERLIASVLDNSLGNDNFLLQKRVLIDANISITVKVEKAVVDADHRDYNKIYITYDIFNNETGEHIHIIESDYYFESNFIDKKYLDPNHVTWHYSIFMDCNIIGKKYHVNQNISIILDTNDNQACIDIIYSDRINDFYNITTKNTYICFEDIVDNETSDYIIDIDRLKNISVIDIFGNYHLFMDFKEYILKYKKARKYNNGK